LNPSRDKRVISVPNYPEQIWCSPNLLLTRYRALVPWGTSGQDMMLTIHLHQVLMLRMSGTIHPLPLYACICIQTTLAAEVVVVVVVVVNIARVSITDPYDTYTSFVPLHLPTSL
jgi:hypothetical protein